MRLHRDVVSGGVLLLAAVAYFIRLQDLPAGKGEPGPRFFPLILACTLFVVALDIVIKGLIQGLRGKTNEEPEWGKLHSLAGPLVAVALTALYVAFFQILGFALSTWIYALSVTVLFRRDRMLKPVVVPVVSTALIYVLFRLALGARLPPGVIPLP